MIKNLLDKKKDFEYKFEDESESNSKDKGASKEEHDFVALKVSSFKRSGLESESNLDYDEVFSNLTLSELNLCLAEILEKIQKLQQGCKNLKQIQVVISEDHNKLLEENFIQKARSNNLDFENSALKIKSERFRK